MTAWLAALESTAVSDYLRVARWGYAALSATHIFGIALLVGAVVPLSLRFLGFWPNVPRSAVIRVLAPMAGVGLALAMFAGILLFSVKARDYADMGVVQVKLVLIAIGALSSLALHIRYGRLLDDAGNTRLAAHAVISLLCWPGALACGRLIAFAAD